MYGAPVPAGLRGVAAPSRRRDCLGSCGRGPRDRGRLRRVAPLRSRARRRAATTRRRSRRLRRHVEQDARARPPAGLGGRARATGGFDRSAAQSRGRPCPRNRADRLCPISDFRGVRAPCPPDAPAPSQAPRASARDPRAARPRRDGDRRVGRAPSAAPAPDLRPVCRVAGFGEARAGRSDCFPSVPAITRDRAPMATTGSTWDTPPCPSTTSTRASAHSPTYSPNLSLPKPCTGARDSERHASQPVPRVGCHVHRLTVCE